jgi:outer membrane protein assembly factor BamB
MVSEAVIYTVTETEVVAIDGRSGAVCWHGRPDDGPAVNVLPVPQSRDAVALLDYMSKQGAYQNIVRIGPDGTIRWRAQLPTSDPTDAYVDMDIDGMKLCAVSWSGHKVTLDLETGQITERRFVK